MWLSLLELFFAYAVPAYVGVAIAALIARRWPSMLYVCAIATPPVIWFGLVYAFGGSKSLANLVEIPAIGIATAIAAITCSVFERRGAASSQTLRAATVGIALAFAVAAFLIVPALPE